MPNCSIDNNLPSSFITRIENQDSSYFHHLQEAKKKISEMTGKKYYGAFIDIDNDEEDDPYVIINDSTAYTTLSSFPRRVFNNTAKEKIWIKVPISLINNTKLIEEYERDLKKLLGNNFIA